MKTLIATMAVLFTMATAASAGSALDRLANETVKYNELTTCMLGANILSQADDLGLSPKDVYDALMFPGNEDALRMVVEFSNSQAAKIRDLRNYGVDMKTVLGVMDIFNYSYKMYMTECVIGYYSIYA
jgi:hypothetical protein